MLDLTVRTGDRNVIGRLPQRPRSEPISVDVRTATHGPDVDWRERVIVSDRRDPGEANVQLLADAHGVEPLTSPMTLGFFAEHSCVIEHSNTPVGRVIDV